VSNYQLLVDGTPVDQDLYDALSSLEVEENLDLPGAIQLHLPVTTDGQGDLSFAGDDRFRPFANLAVVVQLENGSPECIFDGLVLAHRLHLETGVTDSTLRVWGQDSEWLMNLEEKTREWADLTDADVAASIFGEYGITPADANSDDDSPAHTEDGHTLMQRASDIQFLRRLARRSGKVCRVACADEPGQRTGYFARPDLQEDPTAVLQLNEPDNWNVSTLDISWELTGPTTVRARQALFTDDTPEGTGAEVSDSGLPLLDARAPADFAGRDITAMLTAPVDAADELTLRASGLLAEAGWVVRCEGDAEANQLGTILRAGMVVQLDGVGALHSGKYLAWSVRHSLDNEAHRMHFVLVRNAFGPAASGGGGLPGGLL
jgi:Phage tail baseplate hub (GPD)